MVYQVFHVIHNPRGMILIEFYSTIFVSANDLPRKLSKENVDFHHMKCFIAIIRFRINLLVYKIKINALLLFIEKCCSSMCEETKWSKKINSRIL